MVQPARRTVFLLLSAAIAVFAGTRAGHAQTWSTTPPAITAEAIVLAPLTGGALNHLTFPLTLPGATSTVAATNQAGTAGNESAGKWAITVNNNVKRVWVAWQFPTQLVHNTQPTTTLPISFDFANSGAVCELKAAVCGNFVSFNASEYPFQTGFEYVLATRPNIEAIWVYLGGRISPPESQRAGTYTGTVTLRFATANN